MKSFLITENDSNQRVDKFLQKAVPRLPKSLLYKSIRLKKIKLNGKRCEISTRLAVGDTLTLYLNDEFFEPVTQDTAFFSAPVQLEVVYEDENLLLVKKPAGLVVHESDEDVYKRQGLKRAACESAAASTARDGAFAGRATG